MPAELRNMRTSWEAWRFLSVEVLAPRAKRGTAERRYAKCLTLTTREPSPLLARSRRKGSHALLYPFRLYYFSIEVLHVPRPLGTGRLDFVLLQRNVPSNDAR
mmetsp:Transcript_20883/g.45539  ORF Transcript_20883/g.45539 Transcript_20883/m.45539 type:complete len:103 (-) Transcript_20883:912-1220(-)